MTDIAEHAEELTLLVQPEIRLSIDAGDERLTAVIEIDGHNRRRVEARSADGVWSVWQAIEFDDRSGWGPWLRLPIMPRHPVPRDARQLIEFCRWLCEPMTRVA